MFQKPVSTIIEDRSRRDDNRSSRQPVVERREPFRRRGDIHPLSMDRAAGHRDHHILYVAGDQLGRGGRSSFHAGIHTAARLVNKHNRVLLNLLIGKFISFHRRPQLDVGLFFLKSL